MKAGHDVADAVLRGHACVFAEGRRVIDGETTVVRKQLLSHIGEFVTGVGGHAGGRTVLHEVRLAVILVAVSRRGGAYSRNAGHCEDVIKGMVFQHQHKHVGDG